jgi:hypothetical protein
MRYAVIRVVGCALLAGLCWHRVAVADSIFVIENPAVDFEVIDVDDGDEAYFDGIGDYLFPTYNDVALGTFGEARSMAEFDIAGFHVPAGEVLSRAFLELRLQSVGVWGLGLDGTERPHSLICEGYVGNGVAQESDFQIANGHYIDSVIPEDPQVGDILRFSITPHVAALVAAGQRWLGLTLRAETLGGYGVQELNIYPRLTIETALVPEPTALALLAVASLPLLRRRGA